MSYFEEYPEGDIYDGTDQSDVQWVYSDGVVDDAVPGDDDTVEIVLIGPEWLGDR